MIQPIHKSPVNERLKFPIPGQSGLDAPVGRRHVNSKLSAIQKLIFNQQVRPPSRHTYNQVKLSPISQQFTPYEHISQHSTSSPSYYYQSNQNYPVMPYYPSEQQLLHHRYDVMQRRSSLQVAQKIYPLSQANQLKSSIDLSKPTHKRHYSPKQERMNSLDKIINPYNYYQSLLKIQKKQQQHRPLPYKQNSNTIAQQFSQIQQVSDALEKPSYRKGFSPTFLNSFI